MFDNGMLAQVDFALDEVMALQDSGPKDEDVATILEIEQRTFENGQQVKNQAML